MQVISRKVLRSWYAAEYSETEKSLYGAPNSWAKRFIQLLRKAKERSVLELGCGDGRNLIELAKAGLQATGIDLYGKKAVESRAKRLGLSVKFLQKDITQYSPRAQYDGVLCTEVLHLLSRKEVLAVLKKIKAITKKDGLVCVDVLADLQRHFVEGSEEFSYEKQSDYSVVEARKLFAKQFKGWKLIASGTKRQKEVWPLRQTKHPLPKYEWAGNWVYAIYQKQ